VIRPATVRVCLGAIAALALGCGGKPARPEPDDAPTETSADPIEIAGRFDRRCAGGDLEACRGLGIIYAEGSGVAPDPTRAAGLFAKACDGGNLAACNHYALALTEGMGGARQPAKAVTVYQRACDRGYQLACRNLGMMLRDGRGVPVDVARAEALLDRACKGGAPFACTNAGDLDATRARANPARFRDMVAHYKLGCDAGDPTACRQIGVAYLEGRGLPRSTSAAALWLERACVPDDAQACRLLGVLTLQGQGVAKDAERGKQLLARACEAKDVEACRMLHPDPAPAIDAGVQPDGGTTATPFDAPLPTGGVP
jgi:uncharacterized protein